MTQVDSGIHTAYWRKLRKTVAVKRLHPFEQNDASIQKVVHKVSTNALLYLNFIQKKKEILVMFTFLPFTVDSYKFKSAWNITIE